MAEHYHRISPSNQRSLGPFSSPSYNNSYPGIDSLGEVPQLGASGLTPYQGGGLNELGAAEWIDPAAAAATTVLPVAETAAKAGGFSLASLGELKGVIDRMGGIDGIVGSMGKFQKVMAGVTQMAPMIKLMMGSFGKGKTKKNSAEGDDIYYTPSKRRRKKSSTTKRQQTSRRTSTNTTKQIKKRSTYTKK
ncbi:tyrosine protein kinase [Paenibacillus sp. FA6]|uniref:tyrosine protein kinase n=1 Tax=Paenibacillus sp. FA6 TaxID=3413029 RepID=UPI003F656BD1